MNPEMIATMHAGFDTMTDSHLVSLRCTVKVRATGTQTHGDARIAAQAMLPVIDAYMTARGISF